MVGGSAFCAEVWVSHELGSGDRAPDSIMFLGNRTGWICNLFPGVFKTVDGGETWIRLNSNLTSDQIEAVWFVDENKGWAISSAQPSEPSPRESGILVSVDGGKSWSKQTMFPQATCALGDLWFRDDVHGWVTGSCNQQAVILTTSDGGTKWQRQVISGIVGSELRRVRFGDSLIGWAVGPGSILSTKDGGVHWAPQYTDERGIWLNDIAAVTSTEAWAVGGWGFLLHTVDGGAIWSKVPLPGGSQEFVWRICFADAAHGWIVGAKGTIFATKDSGHVWTLERLTVAGTIAGIAANDSHVFVTGGGSQILIRSRH